MFIRIMIQLGFRISIHGLAYLIDGILFYSPLDCKADAYFPFLDADEVAGGAKLIYPICIYNKIMNLNYFIYLFVI